MNETTKIPGYSVDDTVVRYSQNDVGTAIPVFILQADNENLPLTRCDNDTLFSHMVNEKTLLSSGTARAGLQAYFDNGGGPCYLITMSQEQTEGTALAKLLQSVMDTPEITLLSMPDNNRINNAKTWQAVMNEVTLQRPDIFCLIDPPKIEKYAQLFINKFSPDSLVYPWGDHAAAYWPWLKCEYTSAGNNVLVPPSYVIAAIIAQTDEEDGIWKAPANSELIHVLSPDPEAHDILGGPLGVQVNYITSLPGLGTRIWGCSTFMPPRESRCHYVQVRRLLTYIERNLAELGHFMLFEPNNAMTWFKYKGVANEWLRTLWQAGGLAGQSEEEAWSLSIGLGESMTEEDIQNGRIRIVAQVQPSDIVEVLTIQLNLTLYEFGAATVHTSQS